MMYIYVFIRTDIPIANQLVQVGHVCYEAGLKFDAKANTFLVLCQVDNEQDLLEVEMRLNMQDIQTHKFYEPDCDMGFTALCSQPVNHRQRKIFKSYKLWQ